MQRHLVLTAAALALAAGASTRTAAQQRPVSVIVGLGPAQGIGLGGLPGQQGTVHGKLLPSTTPMLGIQAPTPIRGVDVRLTVQHGHPFLALESGGGFVLRDRAYVTTVTADAVMSLPRLAGFRPYLTAGAGVRRFGFDQAWYRRNGSAVVPRDETVPLIHAGAGVAFKLGPADLFAEVSGVSSKFRTAGMDPGGRTVANVGYTLGVRIPLGRRR